MSEDRTPYIVRDSLASPPTQWGDWSYDSQTFSLVHRPSDVEIDLDRCRTSAEVLDWIFQIRHKGWGARAIADLLAAVDDVLDQQRNLR